MKHTTLLIFIIFSLTAFSQDEYCSASYYHTKFEGRGTSNGEVFRNKKFTAAHKHLPFGTWVKLTNTKNDSICFVRVNDRLPQSSKRCIDLTQEAARQLNMIQAGVARVKFEVVEEMAVPEKYKSSIEARKKR
ncbi:MAG: septal ring lytic transglycosylase RlpA family protein [Bacteroidetes bacterium]|nr:septal ring lytic transglycosylase RlpA family protein [Bacteroidota bacterium]